MKNRCAIFDLDMTLGHTSDLLYSSWNAAMDALGRGPMTDEEIVALFGPPEHVALRTVTGDRYPEAFDAYMRHYQANLDSIHIYEGIPEVLAAFREAGWKLGMLTGKGRATTEVTMMHMGMRDLFDLILTGDELAKNKPDPDGIEVILRQLDCDPGDCLMIGDMTNDILAAQAAGVKSVAALWDSGWYDRILALKPDVVCEKVADLHALVD